MALSGEAPASWEEGEGVTELGRHGSLPFSFAGYRLVADLSIERRGSGEEAALLWSSNHDGGLNVSGGGLASRWPLDTPIRSEVVVPGTYTLRAHVAGELRATRTVTLREGEVTPVKIDLSL